MWMSMDAQSTKCHRKIARALQTTDGRATANSELEREFTFAKNRTDKE